MIIFAMFIAIFGGIGFLITYALAWVGLIEADKSTIKLFILNIVAAILALIGFAWLSTNTVTARCPNCNDDFDYVSASDHYCPICGTKYIIKTEEPED